MSMSPVFNSTEIAAIGANTATQRGSIGSRGARGYRVLNLTGVTVQLQDDSGQIMEVIPASSYAEGKLPLASQRLYVVADPTQQTNAEGTAYTTNNQWQVYAEALAVPPNPQTGTGSV